MERSNLFEHIHLIEGTEWITYEIHKEKTNLISPDQLKELTRRDPLFFPVQNYETEEHTIRIYYQKPPHYKPISKFTQSHDQELKRKIALNVLQIEKLIGTQFTTIIHPKNIYASDEGDVMFVHRGIRSVFPMEELSASEMVAKIKKIIVYLYTGENLFNKDDQESVTIINRNGYIKTIMEQGNFQSLRSFLQKNPFNQQRKDDKTFNQLQTSPKSQAKQKYIEQQITSKKKSFLSLPMMASLGIGLLIGLVVGIILWNQTKVVPASKDMSSKVIEHKEETEKVQAENEKLEETMKQQKEMITAYEAALNGDSETAIATLERIDDLTEFGEQLLIEEYANLETTESLKKLARLGSKYPEKVVEKLVDLDSSDAEEALLSIQSDDIRVQIEQAWLDESYEDVIELYKENKDDERAKYLAAKSYLEEEKDKKALKLGEELDDKKIQRESLKIRKEKIKDDDDLDKDERKDKIKKIDKKIKKLK